MRVYSEIFCMGCQQRCEITIKKNRYVGVYYPYKIGKTKVSIYTDDNGVVQSPVHTSFIAALGQARQICAQCKNRIEYSV